MGLMEAKVEIDLYQDVLPWLLNKRDSFLGDQTQAVDVSKAIIEEGILFHKRAHAEFLRKRQEAIEEAERQRQREEEETRQRRASRAQAREKRAKD